MGESVPRALACSFALRNGRRQRSRCASPRAERIRPVARTSSALIPPLMIAFAAMLWGTDGIFRTSLIAGMSNSWAIVTWEHVLLVAATGWLIWRDRRSLSKL